MKEKGKNLSDPGKYNEYKIKDAINHPKHRKSKNDIQKKNLQPKSCNANEEAPGKEIGIRTVRTYIN